MSSDNGRKLSPAEIIIFSVVCGIVLQSAYTLFNESESFAVKTLAPTTLKPTMQGRGLASKSSPLETIDISCDPKLTRETQAGKARISGPICEEGSKSGQIKTIVTHGSYHKPATVFPDPRTNRYSTDYISLNQGQNTIQVKFATKDGTYYTQELVVIKTSQVH